MRRGDLPLTVYLFNNAEVLIYACVYFESLDVCYTRADSLERVYVIIDNIHISRVDLNIHACL